MKRRNFTKLLSYVLCAATLTSGLALSNHMQTFAEAMDTESEVSAEQQVDLEQLATEIHASNSSVLDESDIILNYSRQLSWRCLKPHSYCILMEYCISSFK